MADTSRQNLIRAAVLWIAAFLWTAGITATIAGLGTDRIHLLLLAAALLAGVAAIVVLYQGAAIRRADQTDDAIRQAADELHTVLDKLNS